MIRNVLIIEDKKSHMDVLSDLLSELDKNINIYQAFDIEKAYHISMEQHIHLFLVDIVLHPDNPGDVTGLRFAQEIREVKKYRFTPLIFITSLEDPKLYSYSQLHCFGYIEKPFDAEQVKNTISRALEFPVTENEERFVYFRKDGIVYSKNIKEIIYIENSRRKVVIHCKNDVLEIPYKTCNEILAEIDSDQFIRCSRYTIINKQYIEKIDYTNRYIRLKNIGESIEIGTILKKSFRDSMGR